jgi:ribulose 1,5-bisphosphate synthetase/thiazole synthase
MFGGEGRKPKAVIAGGSIAGISTAHALILAGWDVLILEKTSSPPTGSPTGAGLGLNPLSQQIIQSWISKPPQFLHNFTFPLTIDQVNIQYSPPLHFYVILFVHVFILSEWTEIGTKKNQTPIYLLVFILYNNN